MTTPESPDTQLAPQDQAPQSQDELAQSAEKSRMLAKVVNTAPADPHTALQLVSRAASSYPDCFQCYYNKGVLLEKQGRIDEATNAYRSALNIRPSHLESVINLSNIHLRNKNVSRARQVITAGVKKSPRDLNLRNQLVRVLIASGKFKDASEQAKGVLRIDERNTEAMIHLAQTYYSRKKYELAERILLKAQAIDKTSAVIANRLGFIYLQQNNQNGAIAQFKKAIELNPEMVEAHINLGVLYNRAHDYQAAAQHFRQAIAQAPYLTDAYINLGNALRGEKQYKEAEDAYKKAIELDPKDQRAAFNLGLLYLDDEVPGYIKSERYGLAERHLKKYKSSGAKHAKLASYIEEAEKKHTRALKSEERKRQREEKKRLEEKRKAEEDAKRQAEQEKEKINQPIGGKLGGGKDDVETPKQPVGGKLGGGKDEDAAPKQTAGGKKPVGGKNKAAAPKQPVGGKKPVGGKNKAAAPKQPVGGKKPVGGKDKAAAPKQPVGGKKPVGGKNETARSTKPVGPKQGGDKQSAGAKPILSGKAPMKKDNVEGNKVGGDQK